MLWVFCHVFTGCVPEAFQAALQTAVLLFLAFARQEMQEENQNESAAVRVVVSGDSGDWKTSNTRDSNAVKPVA